MKLSNRIIAMNESPIRKLVPYALEAKARGTKVYHLNIGQPDIKTPEVFFDAVRNFEEPVLQYAHSQGFDQLLKAMAGYYQRIGLPYEKEDIIITNGGSEALQFAVVATCNPGDNLLVPEPFYTNYTSFALPFGVTIKPITTSPEEGFSLPSKETLLQLVDEHTRAIVVSNPGNPTGAIYTKEEVERLGAIAKEKDLFIVADEVYREFAYDGTVTSFGSLRDVADRVIIVDSISKRFSACGARIGSFASKNQDLIKNVMKLAMTRLCVPTLEMIGAAALYQMDPSYFEPIKQEYKKRRDILLGGLQKMPGVLCKVPKGAFYAIAKLPVDNAEAFSLWLLQEFSHEGETVMVAPAEGFYATPGLGTQEVRLAYVLNSEDLARAMEVLAIALEQYPGKTQ